ncbi:transposase family protein [Streptomyces sp. NPDC094447]|uniref:transposase family protein n=1 Tax=Streptomyces sp. NPDC094447 TaxID=3366062 RepID=UPI003815BD08
MRIARTKAFVILDGTLLPIDRIAADTPYYSGKHKRHGMNIQVLTDPFGRPVVGLARVARLHPRPDRRPHSRIVEALTDADLKCWADKAYQGADGSIRVPFRGRRLKRCRSGRRC